MIAKFSPIAYLALNGLVHDTMLVENDASFLLVRATRELAKAVPSESGEMEMTVALSPAVYLTLCGLVKDSLEVESDATFILKRLAGELASATAGNRLPSELLETPHHVEALRRGGFLA